MTQRNNILQELSGLGSSLANLTSQNVFQVPEGYFEGLADQVIGRIRALEAKDAGEELAYLSPVLSNISRQMPYLVPVGYFEGLEARLMFGVRESNEYLTAKEELESISPLLSGLNKKMPYAIPEGYFDELNEKASIPAAKTRVRVISITRRKWFRYAAAAVVTGIIVLAGFIYFNRYNQSGEKALAKFTKDVKKMNEAEKDNLIEDMNTGLKENYVVVTPDIKPVSDVKQLLQGISDEELKDFQEQTEDVEEVLMTN